MASGSWQPSGAKCQHGKESLANSHPPFSPCPAVRSGRGFLFSSRILPRFNRRELPTPNLEHSTSNRRERASGNLCSMFSVECWELSFFRYCALSPLYLVLYPPGQCNLLSARANGQACFSVRCSSLPPDRSEEHTSELQSRLHPVCR